MEKILSIIIPTYNMEEYLSRCVDSLVKSDKIAEIEVFIVNDGSKDSSLEIAKGYESKFPESVIVIDKPNGNYGSTINTALPRVTGKYVKILDADDWFDTNALNLFVEKLRLSGCDMIFTPYTRDYVEGKKEVCNISGVQENKVYDFETFMNNPQIKDGMRMRMHMVSYKREVVTNHGYKQTEGISYTDNEWIFYPLYYVNSIEYVNLNIYQHFIGRNEQTTDPKVKAKNFWQEIIININMLRSIESFNTTSFQSKYMLRVLTTRIVNYYYQVIAFGYSDNNIKYLNQLKEELFLHPEFLVTAKRLSSSILFKIKIHIVEYWNRTGKRYPMFILFLLKIFQMLTKKLSK